MLKRLVIVLLLLALAFGAIFGWKYLQQQKMAAAMGPPPPATVSAVQVSQDIWERSLESVGSLTADQGLYVTNEVSGQIQTITFESGQRVEEGTPLVNLEASIDRAELEGLIADQRLAEIQFERSARLLRDRNISKSDYDIAEATRRRAEAQTAAKRATIEKKTIRAPFSGLLGIRLVDVGEYLSPGSRIVLLQSLDPIHVDYTLPERYFDLLAPGQNVTLTVSAFPNATFSGRVTAIDPGIDPGSRGVRIRATLVNPDERLRPGMFAEVKTLMGTSTLVLTLPRTAISYAPYGDSVFVIREREGKQIVQRQPVETGDVRSGRVEILAGVTAGDRVVDGGQHKLRNGQEVSIVPSAGKEHGGS